MSLETAALISDAANWALLVSLVVGMLSTVLIMWTANIKDNGWLTARRTTQQTIVKLGAAVDEANSRVAAANAAAAEANARASGAASDALRAKASATQAEAALTLTKYKSDRVLTPEQAGRVVEKLLELPPSIFDLRASHDPGSMALMTQMGDMLKAAQWRVQDAPASPETLGNAEAPQGVTAETTPEGITIAIAESRRLDWEPTVIGLVLALREEGVQAAGQASADADPSAIHVIIGGKSLSATAYRQGPGGQNAGRHD